MKNISIGALIVVLLLCGCKEKEEPAAEKRPVRTIVVGKRALGDLRTLTGQITAQDQVSLAFRLDGRMIERSVSVGEKVKRGQPIAKLDPLIQENQVRSAIASVSAAEAQLLQARNIFDRQKTLLAKGYSTREKFDQAKQAQQTAQAQLDSAIAQQKTSQEQLNFTTLYADFEGTVTAVGAETSEVVRAGQAIFQIARGGGLDAVFDVPPHLLREAKNRAVKVALAEDPKIFVEGQVREVAPEADPVTRTYRVKVRLQSPPPEMLLGATVVGTVQLDAPEGIEIPASALNEAEGKPSVWVVDTSTFKVSLRPIEIARHDPTAVIVSKGIAEGESVVTAGVQALHPGQTVRLLEISQ